MPEVNWVHPGLFSTCNNADGDRVKVLTLDAIEAWLRAEDEASQLNGERGYVSVKDLLAALQQGGKR